ncbi:hypothetical protein KKG31_05815 [Patescibacteria group bacterium]|nr:hypothetical protein [Patescibacteria group bacterium]
MIKNPSIVGLIYFNVDYTYGLTYRPIGEADRSAININNGKIYTSIFDLYKK